MTSVIVTNSSGNKKTGNVAATYVSQSTCPTSCPLRGAGCYAENGPIAFHARRLNKSTDIPLTIAKAEASLIRDLPGDKPLRVHVVGDCATPETAAIVGAAMRDYPQPSWTYTHVWREVAPKDWHGASVLASCETTEQVKEAQARGWPTALIVERFPFITKYEHEGTTIVPCPQQTRGTKCVDCLLCTRSGMLRGMRYTIGFEAHGARKKKVVEALNGPSS